MKPIFPCRQQITGRAVQLHEAKVEVQLFNLLPQERDFSIEPFWKDVLKTFDNDLNQEALPPDPLKAQVMHFVLELSSRMLKFAIESPFHHSRLHDLLN